MGTYVLIFLALAGHLLMRLYLVEPIDFIEFAGAFVFLSLVFLFIVRRAYVRGGEFTLAKILFFSFLMHAAYWGALPALSNDAFRYQWDGWMVLHGLDPYRHAPLEVTAFHTSWVQHLPPDHRAVSTVYPPLSLLFFAAARSLGAWAGIYGLLMTGINLLTTVVLAKLLKARGLDSSRCIYFAWHPLLILESAHGGHIDALGVLLIALSLLALEHEKFKISISLVLASVAVKLWPVILVPVWMRRYRRCVLPASVGCAGIAFIFLLLYSFAPDSGFVKYALSWEFNGLFYSISKRLFPASARGLCAVFFLVFLSYAWLKAGGRDILDSVQAIILAYVVFSPTVYPWYLIWLLPFFIFRPHSPFSLWSFTIALSYYVITDYHRKGLWKESLSWTLAIYGVPLILWAIARAMDTQGMRNAKPVKKISGFEIQNPW